MSSLFQARDRVKPGTIGYIVQSLQQKLNQTAGGSFADGRLMKSVISMEGLDQTSVQSLTSTFDTLNIAIEEIANTHTGALNGGKTVAMEGDLKFNAGFTAAQKYAAAMAAMIGSDIPGYLTRDLGQQPAPGGNTLFYAAESGEGLDRRVHALEAYDERENKETTTYSIAYNMQAATQDEFGEALFPTCVVSPDQYGLTISVRLVMVMDDLRRNVSAEALHDFQRKNIIRAAIDPTVLRNDLTRIYPVVRAGVNDSKFVDPALVPPINVLHEGQSILTAPLAIGQTFDLLAIGQTDALLSNNTLDTTDAVDPNVVLDALYMEIGSGSGAEVIKFPFVGTMQGSTFTAAPQGNYRQQMLNFVTDSLPVNNTTTKADGSASTLLAPIVNANAQVKLAVSVMGNVNLQTAETQVNAGGVNVSEIKDASSNVLDPSAGTGATYKAIFAGAKIIGYDLEARRVNTNRRERGQLLDITYQNVVYGVPLLSPITAPRPPAGPQQDEANYLAGLITATRIRTSNAAVQRLLDAEQQLKAFVTTNLGDDQIVKPEILGVGGWFVKAVYEHQNYVAPAVVDSIKSYERAADIQASIVNLIRDMAYRLYRDSGYKAAANALHGGIAPMPTVIIATDTMIAGYLQVVGDFRTLGNEFNVKVVSTTNKLMKNKILFTFGEFGEGRENTPNPLHFGSMAWKPEVTLILPTVRNGANSREVSVSPSFRHIVHLPVMGSIDVSGITNVVLNKVNVNMHTA